MGRSFGDTEVAAVFQGYPPLLRRRLLHLRALIFATAAGLPSIGGLVETLKWGQPAYLTGKPKTGSTIRIGAFGGRGETYAMFVHCQTSLVESFRRHYPLSFTFDGKRALVFGVGDELPEAALKHCIALALTYPARA